MVTMKVNLDLNLLPSENPGKLPDQEVVFGWFRYAMSQKNPKGLHGSMLRTWGRIERKFIKAMEEKLDTIELEEAELDLAKKLFSGSEEINFPVNSARVISSIEDAVMEAKENPVA